MVAALNNRQRAWLSVEERHGDQLIELSSMAKHIGPDEAFNLLLDNMPEDEERLREALRPLFQSALLVAAEVLHRRDEREAYWRSKGK